MHYAMLYRMSSDSEADLIGSTEASVLLSKHPVTLARWVAKGKLTPISRLSGGAFVFRRADIEALVAQEESA